MSCYGKQETKQGEMMVETQQQKKKGNKIKIITFCVLSVEEVYLEA